MSERSEKIDRGREEQTNERLTFWNLIGRVTNKRGGDGGGYGGEVVDGDGKRI